MVRSLLFAAAAGAVTLASANAVTPVEKVVELLGRLSSKIEEEGQAEAVAYDKFACFCKEQADNKLYAIERSSEKIKKLDARIDMLAAEIKKLDFEVAEGNARILDLEEESQKESTLRAKEREAYEEADASISRAIKAVRHAITALQESRPDAELLQQAVSFAAASGLDVSRLQHLVAQPVDRTKDASGLNSNAYEYHSNEIIELLQRLMKQFKARKEKLFVEESTEKHAFEKVEQARQFEITTTTEAVATDSALSAKKSDEKSKKQDEHDTEVADKTSDQEFLDELTKQCENKAKVFDQRSSTRASEMKALSEATTILKGKGGSKYTANKRLNLLSAKRSMVMDAPVVPAPEGDDEDVPATEGDDVPAMEGDDVPAYGEAPVEPTNTTSMVMDAPVVPAPEGDDVPAPEGDDVPATEGDDVPATEGDDEAPVEPTNTTEDEAEAEELATSFIQTSNPKNAKVFALIKAAAQKLRSPTLSALALKLKADHFVKVRGLIKDLIARLEAQADSEATHKDQCDKDMKAAITQRDESQSAMESENASITQNKVTIKELTEKIAELKQSIADAKKALRERTELRAEERAENEKTIADADEGAAAIRDAVKVLEGFYGASLVQIKAHNAQEPFKAPKSGRDGNTVEDMRPEGADTFESEYHGDDDSSSGIFGLLNVIRSDYERTVEDTSALEEVAQNEFEKYEADSETKIAEYETDTDKAKKGRSEERDSLMENEDDLADATKSNESSKKKLALLKGECVDGAISHEERVKRREQEVDSLKEALNILEEMSFMQKRN